MFGLGSQELLLILIIVLILFGGTKIPELSRGLGEAIREIRKGVSGNLDDESNTKKKSKKPSSSN